MDKVANLSASQRRDLFRETAAKRAMNPAIVEKDFWVCWVLKHLFADATFGERSGAGEGEVEADAWKAQDSELTLDGEETARLTRRGSGPWTATTNRKRFAASTR